MQELTPETITQAVLDQMASTPNSRLKQIMASAVKHLHAFAKDVNLTPAEWIKGIAFMTAVGKICTPARQEFILLSDTLGLSALVNGLHDETAMEEGTNTSLLGPFYRETTPHLAAGSQIAKHADPDTEVILYGHVTDVNGKPLSGATVSLWQTSASGLYDIQEDPTSVDYRGIFTTDANGLFLVRTVKPLGYSIPMDGPVGEMITAQRRHGMRPAHIHFLVGAPGYRELVTALYLRDDPHLADDVVFGSSGDLAVEINPKDPDCPI
ncbi:MAG: dioxygenase, partial [Bradyrhizobium sp.]